MRIDLTALELQLLLGCLLTVRDIDEGGGGPAQLEEMRAIDRLANNLAEQAYPQINTEIRALRSLLPPEVT
jgi:hypothetical protein